MDIFELLRRSKDNMKGVNVGVQDHALELVKQAFHHGIKVIITNGYRSFTEQNRLYAQGRTAKGPVVTYARGGESIHNFGYAVDFALVESKGKIHWILNADDNKNRKKDWFEVGAIAKRIGFAWGGDWTKFKDYPHLEITNGLTLTNFRAGRRPSVKNLPKRDYIGMGDTGNAVIAFQKEMNKQDYKLKVDGVFGEGSRDALKDFQGKHGLTADGVYGKKSKEMLLKHT